MRVDATWARIIYRRTVPMSTMARTGIAFDVPARPRVVDTVGSLGPGATCQHRLWIGSECSHPVIEVSVDIEAEYTRSVVPTDLKTNPASVTETMRRQEGVQVSTTPVKIVELGKATAEIDFEVHFTQLDASPQTSAWFVRAIATRSALVVAQTTAFPDTSAAIPASATRPIHDYLIHAVEVP